MKVYKIVCDSIFLIFFALGLKIFLFKNLVFNANYVYIKYVIIYYGLTYFWISYI